jgi:hypothetical protein
VFAHRPGPLADSIEQLTKLTQCRQVVPPRPRRA